MAAIKLPAKVRIGFRVYRIEEWDPLAAQGNRQYGEICYTSSVIRVDVQHGPVKAANTLFHEILHGVCRIGGFNDIERPDEEAYVRQISDVMTQVWQDNPDVMEWISTHMQMED